MSCDQCAACPTGGVASRKNTGGRASRRSADAVIALLGQPNSGKSTLFNGLTGAHQRVGNWLGKTVELKTGTFNRKGRTVEVVDLPGAYALAASSPEEEVTRDYIASGEADAVLVFADASQLERSLYMLANFAGNDTPAVLVLNLMDVAEMQGKHVDADLLEQRLGIPVVPFVASDRTRYGDLHAAIDRALAGEGVHAVERAGGEGRRKAIITQVFSRGNMMNELFDTIFKIGRAHV